MHFGKKNQQHEYKMKEHMLEEVEVEKELGVIVDKDLKFHKHASFVIKKANATLGLIKIYFAVFDHERAQKRATKLIRNIKDLPYSERLDHLKLPSLGYRRGDMLQADKII